MKKTDFIKKLSDLTKITADKLSEIISDKEEFEIEFPEVHSFTNDEFEALKMNLNNVSSKTAVEMAIKAARNKLVEEYGEEFNFPGKTAENLLEFAIKAGEKKANVKPSEALQEKEKVIAALKSNLEKAESEKIQVINEKNQVVEEFEYRSTISDLMPKEYEGPLGVEDFTLIAKNKFKKSIEDGQEVVRDSSGNIIRDEKTQSPIPFKDVMKDFISQKIPAATQVKGRGGEDSKQRTGDKTEFKNMNELTEYASKENLTNEQQVELVRKAMQDNPDFC